MLNETIFTEAVETKNPLKIAEWVTATGNVFRLDFKTEKELRTYCFRIYNFQKRKKKIRLAAKLYQLSEMEQIHLISRGKTLLICPEDFYQVPERIESCGALSTEEAKNLLRNPPQDA